MAGYINISGNYEFDELGVIRVNVKPNARNVSARWKGGSIVVSAPKGIMYDDLLRILRDFSPRLMQIKPKVLYNIGDVLDFGELKVSISAQAYQPDKMFATINNGIGQISVGTAWNMDSADTIKNISKFLCRMAQNIAPQVLIPRGKELAEQVHKFPMLWTISNGHRVLGHCNMQGEIALSYALIFYPQHLRDYVIFHELSHLSEMNHSPRFHEICDSYCAGKEKALVAELKAYQIPIVR